MNEAAAEVATPGLRRRALLRTVAVLGGLAAIKGIGRAVVGTVPPAGPTIGGPWQILTPTAAATITHVALALLGEPGQRAFAERGWRPADGVDRLLGGLAPDQQKALLGAIRLVEEWTPGWYGLSGLSLRWNLGEQVAWPAPFGLGISARCDAQLVRRFDLRLVLDRLSRPLSHGRRLRRPGTRPKCCVRLG